MAPRSRVTVAAGTGRSGCRIATTQDPPPGARPSTRRSPPRLTHTPAAPAARSSPTSRSAAYPLPMPPGSKPTPAGRVTAEPASSTTIPAQPRRSGDHPPAAWSPSSSKVRS